MKKVLILGVNGFIGHHLSQRILETTDWHVYVMDMMTDRITDLLENEAFKTKLATAMQSGTPPDLFQSWGGGTMAAQAAAGNLQDITAGGGGYRFEP